MNVYRDSTEVTRANIADLGLSPFVRKACNEHFDANADIPSVIVIEGGWCKTAEKQFRAEHQASVLYFKATTGRWGVKSRHCCP